MAKVGEQMSGTGRRRVTKSFVMYAERQFQVIWNSTGTVWNLGSSSTLVPVRMEPTNNNKANKKSIRFQFAMGSEHTIRSTDP